MPCLWQCSAGVLWALLLPLHGVMHYVFAAVVSVVVYLALRKMAETIQAAGVPGELVEMDLSLYPSGSQEKLFLQDLYSALEHGGVVAFDNYDRFLEILNSGQGDGVSINTLFSEDDSTLFR